MNHNIKRYIASVTKFKVVDRIMVTDIYAGEDAFISTWNTTNLSTGSSNDNQISLPLDVAGTYNFVINWGDKSTSAITTWNDAAKTHTYSVAGAYTLRITGTCYGWRFNRLGDRLKILNIGRFGTRFRIGALGFHFTGCANMTISATDTLDLTGAISLAGTFTECANINTAPTMSLWNTSAVTDMHDMFNGCTVFNQHVGNWNTSAVTNMRNMFTLCNLFNQSLSSWDVSKVTSMIQMFYNCNAFKQNLVDWSPVALLDATQMLWNINNTGNTTNYDALLNSWSAKAVQNDVIFYGGSSKYSAAASAARLHLTSSIAVGGHNWTITDGGLQ